MSLLFSNMGITYTETLSVLNKLSSFDTATDNYNILLSRKIIVGIHRFFVEDLSVAEDLYQIREDKLVTTGR